VPRAIALANDPDNTEIFEKLGVSAFSTTQIVGSLIEVGRGKRPPGWMAESLRSRDRAAAGQTAPPPGLVLWHVTYPDECWL
jgi:tRNA U38,U39,U40 pseudouridine synthase TruA